VQQFRKIILLTIALMLLIPHSFMSLQAKEKKEGSVDSKDEVIYATLEATGEHDEVFVVNLLNVTKAGIVKDYGDYTSVKNLTGLAEITQTDDKIETEAEKGKLYYQGNMEDVNLPWDISLEYRLDGKKTEPKSLIGKEGELEIEIDVKQNKDANKEFFENYLLQIEIPFNADTTEGIKADDAVIANAGKDELVTFTSMPEEEGTFVVTADVKDFEMEGIDISGVPSSMSIDAPDTGEMTDEIKTLSEAIADVNDGDADIKQGIGELNKGSSELADG